MTKARNDFETLLRPISATPPLSWVRSNPAWWVDSAGKGIRIDNDPDSPEAGRAIGYVSPPPGERCYMNAPEGQVCIPTPVSDVDGFRTFHADTEIFADEDGTNHEVPIGSIPLGGGHSNRVGADATPEQSAEWLQRKGRWSRLLEDIGLYGTVEQTPNGVLFRGWVAENVTVAEATGINRTVMSGEWVPSMATDPELGGQLVFSGVTRVKTTALPMRELPMAAGLESCGCDLTTDTVVHTFATHDLETMDYPPNSHTPDSVLAQEGDMLPALISQVEALEARVQAQQAEIDSLTTLAAESEAQESEGPQTSLSEVLERMELMARDLADLKAQSARQDGANRSAAQEIQGVQQSGTDRTSSAGAVSQPRVTS